MYNGSDTRSGKFVISPDLRERFFASIKFVFLGRVYSFKNWVGDVAQV
jgi:hypothetical protein